MTENLLAPLVLSSNFQPHDRVGLCLFAIVCSDVPMDDNSAILILSKLLGPVAVGDGRGLRGC